jgi:mono/diheme cytochrome c family protein
MRFAVVSFGLALVLGCGKNQSPPAPTSGSPNAQPESAPPKVADNGVNPAQQMFDNVCAACHGFTGMGDGPGAATLNPKPRNYTDAAWQASITDDTIRQTILKGGQAMGKSAMMPGQPQLKDHPEILDGLVKIIRGFKK